jgi:cytosine permease
MDSRETRSPSVDPVEPDERGSIEDYADGRVPESQTQRTWDISLVRMGLTVSASDLVFGYTIGLYFGFWQAVLISLVISLVIAVVSVGMGMIGFRERITFALTTRFAFGREGSRLPSLVMAVVIALFYGYILGITVAVFPGANNTGVQLVYCIVLGAIYLVISGFGFAKGLKWMGRVGVPLMVALVVVADVLTITHAGGFGAILDAQPQKAGGIALAALVGSGISKWMAGATISADITRFGRSASSVWTTTLAEFVLGNFGFNLLGLILGLGLRTSDLGAAFGIIGLTWLASIAFFVQSVTVETNELYAASLATANGAGLSRRTTNLIVALLGVAIGFYGVSQGIIASFLTFIGYLGYALPVIPGIILVDYYVVHRMNYSMALDRLPAVNVRAVAAFFVTVAINIVTGVMGDSFWHVLPLFGGIVYLLFSIPQTAAAWRSAPLAATRGTTPGGAR